MVMTQTYRDEERVRLDELRRYQVLDSAPEPAFERVVGLAQRFFGVPIVLISLVDEDRQWFKARRGLNLCETDLESSFCVHAIRQDEVMVVPDATQDARFLANPLVTGEPFIRFYAGVPLQTARGHKLGTLCLIDAVPHHKFGAAARVALSDFAELVVDEFELRLATREVERQQRRIQTVFESITEAFFTVDRQWRFSHVNAQAGKLMKRDPTELLGRELWAEFPEATASVAYTCCLQAVATGTSETFEFFYPPLNTWFDVHVYPSDDGLSAYFQDINARKEAELKARVQADFRRDLLTLMRTSLQSGLDECFYQHILEEAVRLIPDAQAGSLFIKDGDRYRYVAAVGFDLQALQSCTFNVENTWLDYANLEPQLVHDWKTEKLDEENRAVIENEGRAKAIEVSLVLPVAIQDEAAAYFCLDNFETARAFDAEAVEMARVFAQQVATLMQRLALEADLRTKQEALEYAAHNDVLTGLPNRYVFDDRLEQALAQGRRSRQGVAVMFLDLDNFKYVNDTYGHAFGDRLIKAVAARLSAELREIDTLARWGGDEFMLLFPGLDTTTEVAAVAERLLERLRQPFELAGLEIRTGASIGVSSYTDGPTSAEDLIKNADIALYRAKADRGSYHFFTDDMKEKLRLRVELGRDLRAALEARSLTLHYQPKVQLSTGLITGLEALARWQHPERSFISPAVFIPLAEELGLIRQLGAQMLDKACAQAKAWRDAGLEYRVAVNPSVEQLKHPDIVQEVRQTLRRYDLDPRLLELEVTESTAMADVEGSIKKLQRFRAMGIRLAIDDFGTAYSSLAYLKRLPVHSLKIDRSFIQDIDGETPGSEGDSSIVQAILALGNSLGLHVVAEGVETQAQRKTLLQLGCSEAQGYLFAKPLSAGEVGQLLEHRVSST